MSREGFRRALLHMWAVARPKKYDAVIVGSGPGGFFLGYLLAKAGAKILILEKERLPRYKVCGGGLTPKALAVLPFDVSDVVEEWIFTARVFVRELPVLAETWSRPLAARVMRVAFDRFLVREAVSEGADFLDENRFRDSRKRPEPFLSGGRRSAWPMRLSEAGGLPDCRFFGGRWKIRRPRCGRPAVPCGKKTHGSAWTRL